ncbi:MAG: hypothetical protein AAGA70_18315, partial [Pseudomonadota bacterium]
LKDAQHRADWGEAPPRATPNWRRPQAEPGGSTWPASHAPRLKKLTTACTKLSSKIAPTAQRRRSNGATSVPRRIMALFSGGLKMRLPFVLQSAALVKKPPHPIRLGMLRAARRKQSGPHFFRKFKFLVASIVHNCDAERQLHDGIARIHSFPNTAGLIAHLVRGNKGVGARRLRTRK